MTAKGEMTANELVITEIDSRILGGILLGLLETLVAGYVSSVYKNLFAYIILLIFLFLKPTGIFNERAIQDV